MRPLLLALALMASLTAAPALAFDVFLNGIKVTNLRNADLRNCSVKFDGDGNVVGDAVLEFTQVDSAGRYPASRDDIAKSGFTGFARVGTGTDAQQRFVVETVKPGRITAGEATLRYSGGAYHTGTCDMGAMSASRS